MKVALAMAMGSVTAIFSIVLRQDFCFLVDDSVPFDPPGWMLSYAGGLVMALVVYFYLARERESQVRAWEVYALALVPTLVGAVIGLEAYDLLGGEEGSVTGNYLLVLSAFHFMAQMGLVVSVASQRVIDARSLPEQKEPIDPQARPGKKVNAAIAFASFYPTLMYGFGFMTAFCPGTSVGKLSLLPALGIVAVQFFLFNFYLSRPRKSTVLMIPVLVACQIVAGLVGAAAGLAISGQPVLAIVESPEIYSDFYWSRTVITLVFLPVFAAIAYGLWHNRNLFFRIVAEARPSGDGG